MAELKLPFPKDRIIDSLRSGSGGNDLSAFAPELQAAAQQHLYVGAYLKALPVDDIGVPAFYPKLTRDLQKIEHPNLIYPINGDLLVHIYPDPTGERNLWIPIEPTLAVELNGLVKKVDTKLLDMAEEIGQAKEDERQQVFEKCLNQILTTRPGSPDRIQVTPLEMQAARYLTLRDKLGLGPAQPLIQDPYIEDISCSGVGAIFIEHKVFKSLTTAIQFLTHEELDDFVVWLGERIKKPVTLRRPIVDAVLPDGSRINIVYGRDIAKRGSNFTVRKFAEEPISVLKLIEFGSLNYVMAAYLWMAIEDGLNVFVSGATASGKTTLLNAITTFVKPEAKVVTIEDTPELMIPHPNWLREVVRQAGQDEKGATVDMFDLLRAALRQRPDRIMIGEIRGVEGNIAFQAMQTGHGVMATFHASSVQKLIQRLCGDPINVPRPNVDNLDIIVIQSAVRGPDGRTVRRVVSINELVGYDSSSNTFSFITAFRWRPDNDTFEFPGDMNSYVMEEKLARKRGLPESKKREIYTELRRRARVLERLQQRGDVDGFQQLFQLLTEARKQGLV